MQVAAYYFPNYHSEPRNNARHGRGWTEWELMKCARSRFPGHVQPKVPLWGYEDESDPTVMSRKIEAAISHGLDTFVFDWYWYDGPYLEGCLNRGFLGAKNNQKMTFALMWANHDWKNIHPIGRNTNAPEAMDFPWQTTKESVGAVWEHVIHDYMLRPNYWRIDGLPYFSIYAVNRFIIQMGGVESCAEVLEDFRARARKAGLPGIHLNGIWFDILDNHPACSACPQGDWARRLGFSSYTSYNNVFVSKVWFNNDFPRVDYNCSTDEYLEIARKAQATLPAPYYPVVTASWDSSPRCIQSEIYEAGSYPWLPVMEATPQEFGRAVRLSFDLLSQRPKNEQVLFINAWNEWTEGSYLEPDTRYQDAFLQELQKAKEAVHG